MLTKLQKNKNKKVKKLAISLLYLTFIFITNSCIINRYQKQPNSDFDSRNCVKYTLFYKEKMNGISGDSLLVTGKTQVCASKKILRWVDIVVYDDSKKEIINISSDEKGNFSFKIKSGYYSLRASCVGYDLQIPKSYFGDFGNALKMNMFLSSHPVMTQEINDPTLSKEIDKLKKRKKI